MGGRADAHGIPLEGSLPYVAEIERASRDGSWETDRRRTARLLYERLEPLKLVLPPDLALSWASPAGREDGVTLMFEHLIRAPRFEVRQQMLRLMSTLELPHGRVAGPLHDVEAVCVREVLVLLAGCASRSCRSRWR